MKKENNKEEFIISKELKNFISFRKLTTLGDLDFNPPNDMSEGIVRMCFKDPTQPNFVVYLKELQDFDEGRFCEIYVENGEVSCSLQYNLRFERTYAHSITGRNICTGISELRRIRAENDNK